MGGWCESPLSGPLHCRPLVLHVENKRMAVSFALSISSFTAITKPKPGTPSRHLFADEAKAVQPKVRGSRGKAPKADIESISSFRPAFRVASAISSIGFSMPLEVSQ